ncbi:MAG: GntR family transcriptional regulator [Microcella sp.]|uniref:GntR family transcriptional regulator n=1 Tax=Microcella sp. TaxID=1913979 RepID=UPI0033155189
MKVDIAKDTTAAAIAQLWDQFSTLGRSSEAVYLTLREAILSRALEPGSQYSEEDLSGMLGLSRTPIREACLRLVADHLMVRRGRRLAISEISHEEVLEIYDVRAVLDGLAARQAAIQATPPEIAQLRWLLEQMSRSVASGNTAESFKLNHEFHDYLAYASHNSFLQVQVRTVQDRVRRFPTTTFEYQGRPQTILQEHAAIVDAIESKDPEGADAAAVDHIASSRLIRLKMLPEST